VTLKPHLSLRKKKQSQPINKSDADDGDDDFDAEIDYQIGYRRRDLDKSKSLQREPEEEVSDYVKFRLFLARNLALMKLQEVRG
jgi:hypothetical protein